MGKLNIDSLVNKEFGLDLQPGETFEAAIARRQRRVLGRESTRHQRLFGMHASAARKLKGLSKLSRPRQGGQAHEELTELTAAITQRDDAIDALCRESHQCAAAADKEWQRDPKLIVDSRKRTITVREFCQTTTITPTTIVLTLSDAYVLTINRASGKVVSSTFLEKHSSWMDALSLMAAVDELGGRSAWEVITAASNHLDAIFLEQIALSYYESCGRGDSKRSDNPPPPAWVIEGENYHRARLEKLQRKTG